MLKNQGYTAYANNKIMTASPAELTLMLYEGAIKFCNIAITLCHMVDKMMTSYLQMLEQQFITQGGIKERMHRARTQYRKAQDEELARLRKEVPLLKSEIQRLKDILKEHGIDF